jgi:hypothetical protein
LSRLDSVIRRLTAQRDLLNHAATLIAGQPGHVLELGLGNGRTYDHLRSLLPFHEIFVFDRRIAAHPDSVPDEAHIFLGDFAETLPQAVRRLGRTAILAHCDIGSGDRDATAALARWLGPAVAPLLAPGAIVLADQPLTIPGAMPLAQPAGVPADRYYCFRLGGTA